MQPSHSVPPPRRFGRVNWIGLWTLYVKEVRRFNKVFLQTVAAPVVTTLIYLAIFTLALGRSVEVIQGVPFNTFLAPGLIVMAIAQNAFANTSSSLVIAKLQGNIVDVLMPPVQPWELALGYVLGGITRGIVVGTVTALALLAFVPYSIHDFGFVLFHGVCAASMLSIGGVLAGLWAEKFDHLATVTNFIVTPFAFLSGTFYSIERLPDAFQTLAHLNPFFYMIDGFRYGFIGRSDASLELGLAVMAGVNMFLWVLCWRLFMSGYKLKS